MGQPAEMRAEHLHCAIMYSKWLHKCFFLSSKKRNVFKIFIVEASLKVSLCYPFRGVTCKIPIGQQGALGEKSFQDIKK